MLPKTVSAIMVAASPLATFTLSPFTLIGATMRRPVGVSAADAVVAGAAAAGFYGASGRPAERIWPDAVKRGRCGTKALKLLSELARSLNVEPAHQPLRSRKHVGTGPEG